jgi:hypothetical protein
MTGRWERRRDECGPRVRARGVDLELREPCEERWVVVLREVDGRQAGEGEGGEHAEGAHTEEQHVENRGEIVLDEIELFGLRRDVAEADGEGAECWELVEP